jgi:hypothetical protein
VLLLLSLGYLPYLPRAEFSDTWEWIAGIVLLVEIAVQSGGLLHLAVGEPGRPSAGTKLTRTGALLIAAALIALAVG